MEVHIAEAEEQFAEDQILEPYATPEPAASVQILLPVVNQQMLVEQLARNQLAEPAGGQTAHVEELAAVRMPVGWVGLVPDWQAERM